MASSEVTRGNGSNGRGESFSSVCSESGAATVRTVASAASAVAGRGRAFQR